MNNMNASDTSECRILCFPFLYVIRTCTFCDSRNREDGSLLFHIGHSLDARVARIRYIPRWRMLILKFAISTSSYTFIYTSAPLSACFAILRNKVGRDRCERNTLCAAFVDERHFKFRHDVVSTLQATMRR